MIERIQRRVTKLIEGFRDISYSECLSVRGDLIQVFKILLSKDRVDFNKKKFKFNFQIEQEAITTE